MNKKLKEDIKDNRSVIDKILESLEFPGERGALTILGNRKTFFNVKDFKALLDKFDLLNTKIKKYVECHECGSFVNKDKVKILPVMEKDLPNNSFILGFLGMTYNDSDKTVPIYFCKHCKVTYPKKK